MPKKWIVLLDVDDTCAMSNSLYGQHNGGYRYHEPLFQALKKANLVQVYLFTSYSLRAIAKNLVEEPITTPSRLKLIEHLSGLGFQVEGVITSFDLVFNQGVGAYYEQRIKPYERQVLQGIDLQSKSAVESYVLACEQEEKLRKDTHEISLDKGNLYGYLVQQLEKTLLQNNFAFILADDRSFHIDAVQKQNALHRYPLCSLLAKPRATLEEYLTPLQKFIHSLTIEAIKMRFEQRASLNQEMQKEYETLYKRFHSHLSGSIATLDDPLLEEIECFCIRRDAVQDRNRFTIPTHPKPLSWPELDASAASLRQKIEAIISTFATTSSEPQVELYGLASTPILIPLRLARQLLSQDEQGNVIKKNSTGNNVVTDLGLGQVFFKSGNGDQSCPTQLYPVVEQAVYQMNRQLGGELVAPTQLLLLKMPEGRVPLQASLAIEGVSLEEIISIPGILNGFKRVLGSEEALLTFFPSLLELMDLSGKSYSEWLSRRGYALDMPWEEQLKIVLDTLYALSVNEQPDGLMGNKSSREAAQTESEKRKIVEDIIRKDFQKEPLLPVLALIDVYPKLTEEAHLGDLFMIPNCFRLLRRLYPRMSSEPCLKAALNIISNFDLDNLHRHFLLALLTEPGDHKGDNFIVPLKFDADGTLLPFKIIAIDNDTALEGCFRRSREEEHSLKVKTVIYRLISGISRPFSPTLINTLCAKPAEVLLLEWLGEVIHYSKPYSKLKKEGVLFSGLYEALHLETPFPLGTVERLRHRLHTIQTLLSTSPTLTAEALLLKIEPLVGRYYQRFGDDHPELQTFVIQLFKHAPSLEVLLSDSLDAKTIAEHLGTLSSSQTPLPSLNRKCVYQAGIEVLIRAIPVVRRDARFLHLCSVLARLGYTQGAVTSLTLTEHTAAEIYTQEPEGFIRFLKACETVILQFGQTSLPLNDPKILFHSIANPSSSKIVLLNFLLAYGLSVNIARPMDGFTPLHFAASFYPEGVLPLLQAGAHTEALDTQGLTPLDLAVLHQQTETVGTLLKCGAGEYLRVSNGFKLISRYQRLYPELCQALISRHRELAWQLALEHVSQTTETAERVCLIGPHNKRYLKSEVYQQIFKGASTFPKTNLYGRHNVVDIICTFGTVSMGMHLKENPELPGREIMVQALASQLFGFITPHVALWRFSKATGLLIKTEVGYPVLASHTITGKPLTEVLENHPKWLAKLDPRSVHEAIVLAMLINPEDGRGDNYMVQPFLKGSETAYRLVSIDNDHAFVRPVLLRPDGQEVSGPQGLTVKTILYCLDAMQGPMVEELRRRLLAIDVHVLLSAWLHALQKKQEEINRLFNEPERRALKSKNIHVDIAFQPSIVVDIYQKLLRMQAVLRRTPNISLLELLRRVIPSLGIRYEAAFQSFHSASDRFMSLTKGQFANVIVAGKPRLASKTPTRDIINYTPQLKVEELKIIKEQEASPQYALDCLKRVAEEFTHLRKIRDEVQRGEFKQFRALMNSDNQERVVNGQEEEFPGLDFAEMKLPDQIRVLEELQRISFRRLKIHNCEALTDAGLNSLLTASNGLLALDIENCPQLTDQAIKYVARRCPCLEKLGVRRLPGLHKLIELPFPKLRVLAVGSCPNLNHLRISAPQLARIEINQAQQLARLSTQSLVLTQLRLRDCSRISNEQFNKIMTLPENLQRIQLTECLLISHADFYQKYPQLVQLPIHLLSKKVVAELNQRFEQALSELDLELPLSVNMIEALRQGALRLIGNEQQLIAALLKGLNDSNFDVRTQAIAVLGKLFAHLGPATQAEIVSALLNDLYDSYFSIIYISSRGAQAAEALGKLGAHFSPVTQVKVVTALRRGLNSDDFGVRSKAVEALGKLAAHLHHPTSQAEMVSALRRGLNDKDSNVSVKAVETLGKLVAYLSPMIQTEVVSTLLECLNHSDWDFRVKAAEALGKLVAHLNPSIQAKVLSALLESLNDSYSPIRFRAIEALGKLGAYLSSTAQAELVSGLWKGLNDRDSNIGAQAVVALGDLGSNLSPTIQTEVVSALLKGLNHGYSDFRVKAVEALGKLAAHLNPTAQAEMVSALRKGLNDRNFDVRARAVTVLGKLAAHSSPMTQTEVVSTLLQCLNDNDYGVRAQAIEVVGNLWPSLSLTTQGKALSALLKGLKDYHFNVRAQVVKVLGELGAYLNPTTQAEVVNVLLEGLNDNDSEVRVRAVEALGKFVTGLNFTTQPGMVSALLECLNDSHPSVRVCTMEVLSNLGASLNPTIQAEIVSTSLKGLNHNGYDVRIRAVEALGKLVAGLNPTTQTEVVTTLLKGLNDSDSEVRVRAVEVLGTLWAHLNTMIPAEIVSVLLESLTDSYYIVRVQVMKTLGKLEAHLSPATRVEGVSVLLKSLNDSDSKVRVRAVEALGKLATVFNPITQAEVVTRLLKGLNDSDSKVRVRAVEALGKLAPVFNPTTQAEVVSTLLKRLSNNEAAVRVAAGESIVHLFSSRIMVDNLIYAFKAAYQKEFSSQNSKRRMKESQESEAHQERKEKQEASTRIKRVPEDMREVDVPADGTCLFYSVMFAFLLPVINDNVKFRARYLKLFGDDVLDSAEENRTRLQEYDGDPEFISKHTAAFEVLVNTTFRQRVVKYMRDNPEDFKVFIDTEVESFETYMRKMADPRLRAWGGQPEIVAISRLLEVNVQIYANQEGSAVPVRGGHYAPRHTSDCRINLVYTSVHQGSGPNNHYHYLIEKEYLKKRSISNLSSSSSSQSILPSFSHAGSGTKAASLRSLSSGADADEEKGILEAKTMAEEQTGVVKQSASTREVRLGWAERQAYELALAESLNDPTTEEKEEQNNDTKEDIDNNANDINPEEDCEGDDMERSPGLGLGIGK